MMWRWVYLSWGDEWKFSCIIYRSPHKKVGFANKNFNSIVSKQLFRWNVIFHQKMGEEFVHGFGNSLINEVSMSKQLDIWFWVGFWRKLRVLSYGKLSRWYWKAIMNYSVDRRSRKTRKIPFDGFILRLFWKGSRVVGSCYQPRRRTKCLENCFIKF